jgi:hypothetical protein
MMLVCIRSLGMLCNSVFFPPVYSFQRTSYTKQSLVDNFQRNYLHLVIFSMLTKEARRFAHDTHIASILSITGSLRFSVKMDVEVKTSRSDWLNCSNIWLLCVENTKYSVSLKDCPAIVVNVRVAHVSPADKPLVRRRLLVAENS